MTTRGRDKLELLGLIVGPGIVGVGGAFLLQAVGGFAQTSDLGFMLLFFGGLFGSALNGGVALHDHLAR